ncbi:MAG TPA: HEAT repeat domain-containing protein [Urbifossiella sp.]
MRRIFPFVFPLVLAFGCKKNPPAPPPPVAEEPVAKADAPAPAEETDLQWWLVELKSKKPDKQRKAAEELSVMAETDEAAREALVDLLRDKTTAGAGKTHPTQFTSIREAAAFALLRAGPKGEAALTDKGMVALREGLSDKDPAIREHTAHTLAKIGPPAKPLANQLLRMCAEDKDPKVRSTAFDALRSVGVVDVPGLASLLNNKDAEVRRRAAEVISTLPEVPPFAVPSLARALEDDDVVIRVAAAMGIAAAGPKGASKEAAANLAAAAKRGFPPTFDPKTARNDDPQVAYFVALTRQGKLAVGPTVELLRHKNAQVRELALQTLGEIGADAKEAAPAIRDLLTDPDVALEAAVALYRVGEKDLDNAVRLIESAFMATDPGTLRAAIQAVSRMGPVGKKLMPEVFNQFTSKTPEVRLAAVGYLGSLEPAEAAAQIAALTKLTADEFPRIRRRVGVLLEKLGPAGAPAADAVGKALASEKDDSVRDQFVDALIAMGPAAKPAIVGLAPILSDSSATAQSKIKVIGALIKVDPGAKAAADALIVAANDRDPYVRRAAAAAMGHLHPLPDEARNRLVKLLKSDAKYDVMTAAARGLAAAGSRAKAAKPDLETVAAGKLPGPAFWAKVALVAIEGDVTKAGAVVREGMTGRNGNVRVAAAEALMLVGPTAADVPVLLKISKESTTGAAEAAARAFGQIGAGAKDAVPRLIEMLGNRDQDVRTAAAEALGRIGSPGAAPAVPKLVEAMRSNLIPPAVVQKALDRLAEKPTASTKK